MSTSIVAGMDYLRRDNPWPAFNSQQLAPEYLSLDGGGRELIVDLIKRHEVSILLEIGCFLCGSTRQWLEASPTIEVIGVDPWDGNWGPYLRGMRSHPNMARLLTGIGDLDAFIDAVETAGNFVVALNNIIDLRDRFIPVRRFSPEAVEYIAKRGIKPQLAFIDAFKRVDELDAIRTHFPDCIISGDDWNWKDEDGVLRMQQVVGEFAEAWGYRIIADRATWLLERK